MSMEIKSINDLQPDQRNANKGSERGLYMLEKSLSELGAGRSILVDKEGHVIAGNKTLQEAVNQGYEIVTVKSDGKKLVVVQREDLELDGDDGKARRLAYADNRVGEVDLVWELDQLIADYEDPKLGLDDFWLEDEIAGLNTSIEIPEENKLINEDEMKDTKNECPKCGFKW